MKTAKTVMRGDSLMQGYEVTDNACYTLDSCFNLSFLGIEDIQPEKTFKSQGWLGFGPDKSLPEEASVAFHPHQFGPHEGQLAVWFEELSPEQGLAYFFNLGDEHWSLPMTNMKFNAASIQPEHMHGLDPMRVATIDATSKDIKLGRAQFELLASNIVDTTPAMELNSEGDLSFLQADALCDVFSAMGELEFDFDGKTITLQPADYLE